MLSVNAKPIYLYSYPVHMQKGFEGLSALVEQAFPNTLFSGSYFVFLNRSMNKLKVLYFDIDGMAIWYKKLEKGTFNFIKGSKNGEITRKDFLMILEGITPQKINRRFSLKNR